MQTQWTLKLEDANRRDPTPADSRLARALKCLLRMYGFRCVELTETGPQPPAKPAKEKP